MLCLVYISASFLCIFPGLALSSRFDKMEEFPVQAVGRREFRKTLQAYF